MAKGCIAGYLTFGKTAKSICMFLSLRASTVNDAITAFRLSCSFVAINAETGIREKVISILMAIVRTLIHHITHIHTSIELVGLSYTTSINTLSHQSSTATCLLFNCTLLWTIECSCSLHQSRLLRGRGPLLICGNSTQACVLMVLVRIGREKVSCRKLKAVFEILRYRVMVAAKLRDIKEVVGHRVFLCEMRTVTDLTGVVVIYCTSTKQFLVVIRFCAALISFLLKYGIHVCTLQKCVMSDSKVSSD